MRLHKWLAALINRARQGRKSFLISYWTIYATRRQRRMRSMSIETHIADQWRILEDRQKHPYVWRNDFFFSYAGKKELMAMQRRPRKRVNSFQIRRMLSEHITPVD